MHQHVDLGSHLAENGPIAKLTSKDRDRRKSQGKSKITVKPDFYLHVGMK